MREITQMNKVLITGGTGFIGSAVINALSRNDYEIHATYRSVPGVNQPWVHWHKCDLTSDADVQSLFHSLKPDYLIQMAWCTGQGTYWTDPANLDWVTINMTIARAFVKNGGSRCLFAGTSAEYDWSSSSTLNEHATNLKPLLLYGGAKLATYWVLRKYFEQEKLSFAWLRFFNPFGEGEDVKRLIPKTCMRLLRGELLTFDAALSLRDFLHIEDVGEAIADLLKTDVRDAVNIASGEAVSVRNLVSEIATIYQRSDQVAFAEPTEKDLIADMVVADTSLLNNIIKWRPKKTFYHRLEQTCRWWQRQIITNQV
ncbi:MAG: NAD(P)-dependent oxidoreductase [Chitinophagaceae bacterium]|nr:MAG: NAD(P)-dependent oxidoreductase [Chitinophagaceae bacterium]